MAKLTTEGPYAPTEDRCNARTRRKTEQWPEGIPCPNRPLVGRRRCRMHGGNSGRPPKHGRRSKTNVVLRDALKAAEESDEVWNVQKPLGVLQVHLERAAERAEQKDTPDFRMRARALMGQARDAIAEGDQETARDRIAELSAWLDRGVAEDKALAKLADAAERMGNQQHKAWDTRLKAAGAINAHDLLAILAKFQRVIREEVDAKAFQRINLRIQGEVLGGREVGRKCITRPPHGG